MKSKSALWLLLVAMLIIVPLLVACGGTTPAPTPTPPPPTPTPTPPPTGGPTAIPHTLEGRDDCLICHSSGDLAVPADHAGRTNDTCATCHKGA